MLLKADCLLASSLRSSASPVPGSDAVLAPASGADRKRTGEFGADVCLSVGCNLAGGCLHLARALE